MLTFRADLHLHTLLSACAEVEMIPPLIVDEALRKGLDVIAVTDHNATGNAEAVMKAAEGTGLTVLPGMELQTREEVELLCIFDSMEQAEAWQAKVDSWLPSMKNDAERFGPQFVVDAEGDFVREDTRMLQAPALVALEEAARAARELDGLVIPAHIDRQAKGLIPVLGFWPPDLEVDAAEVSYNIRPSQARERYPSVPEIPLISSSDAHWLDWIGKVITVFELTAEPSIGELRRAFQGLNDRRVYVP
jgi:hypothetical protein